MPCCLAVTAAAFSGELPRIRHDTEGLMDKTGSRPRGESKIDRKQRACTVGGVAGTEEAWTASGNIRGNMPVNRRMIIAARASSAIAIRMYTWL